MSDFIWLFRTKDGKQLLKQFVFIFGVAVLITATFFTPGIISVLNNVVIGLCIAGTIINVWVLVKAKPGERREIILWLFLPIAIGVSLVRGIPPLVHITSTVVGWILFFVLFWREMTTRTRTSHG